MSWELLFVVYWSFFVFPFIVFLIYKYLKLKNKTINQKLLYFVCFLLSLLFIYARFIEPNILLVKHQNIKTGFEWRFILLADLHLWIYKDEKYLQKIVNKINEQKDVDGVLIPGDFTLVLNNNHDLDKLFSPLKNIKYPIFATLWNHDTMHPWPDISQKLIKILEKNNVIVLENKWYFYKNKNIQILWLWDNWSNNDKVEMIDEYELNQNLIVLAHNPDTTLKYSNNIADLTVSWHTHWGQIRIPFIRKSIVPVKWNFISWFYENNWNKLYVTSWVWEVWLPMRFRIPPEIIILDLKK